MKEPSPIPGIPLRQVGAVRQYIVPVGTIAVDAHGTRWVVIDIKNMRDFLLYICKREEPEYIVNVRVILSVGIFWREIILPDQKPLDKTIEEAFL